MPNRPLCFVLMPFGSKKDPGGGPDFDFDAIYREAIRPAIEDAGLQPIRADEERLGGIIHKPMFERLLLCDYAVADLTTANPNVFYELGVRHATRPATTLAVFAAQTQLPFDVTFLRALPYRLAAGNALSPETAAKLRSELGLRLRELRSARKDAVVDSPLFQLLGEFRPPDIARLKTDVFRDRVRSGEARRGELAAARAAKSVERLLAFEAELGDDLADDETGILVDLMLSYRALEQWPRMIALIERFPAVLRRTILVREQLALALNRDGQADRAIEVLSAVLDEQGPSSETLGLLGRVYKDLWEKAVKAGESFHATGYLQKAIAAYDRGFSTDPRDAFPGINALTLLDVEGSAASRRRSEELIPVVRFAIEQRLASKTPDYWDHASKLELSVLAERREEAEVSLASALATRPESWMARTTSRNLRLIRGGRAARREVAGWLDPIVEALEAEAGS